MDDTTDLTEVQQKPLTLVTEHEIAVRQTEALTVLAAATKEIASFITGGGLSQLLSGYARSQAVKDILGGLAAHDGRNSLDARVLGQNALEITEAVELVFRKYAERLAEKDRDPEIHKPAETYVPLRERLSPLDELTKLQKEALDSDIPVISRIKRK